MSSFILINKYRLYCNTSSQWEYTFATTPPTVCPINATHTVNVDSASIVDTIYGVTVTHLDSPYSMSQSSVFCDTTSGNVTLYLPKCTACSGMTYVIKKIASVNSVLVVANGSDLIDGGANKMVTALNGTVVVRSDGIAWASIDFYNGDVIDDYNALSIAAGQKGNIMVDNGTELTALNVGSNGSALIADNTMYHGIKWTLIDHATLLSSGANSHVAIDNHISASSGVHGVSGTIVGTQSVQTLTNKIITSPTNTIRARQLSVPPNNYVNITNATPPTTGQSLAITNISGELTASWQATTASAPGTSTNVIYNNNATFGATNVVNIDPEGNANLSDFLINNVTAPLSGTKLFSDNRSSRKMMSQSGALGYPYSFQTLIAQNKIGWWFPEGNSTVVSNVNLDHITKGSETAVNVSTVSIFTQMCRISYGTSGKPGNTAGVCHGSLQFWRGNGVKLGGFLYVAKFGCSQAAAGVRFFCGFTTLTTHLGNVEPSSLTNVLAFASDTNDNKLYFMHNDGTGTATKDLLSNDFSTTTAQLDMYECRIFCPSNDSTVYYSIYNIVSGVYSSGSTNVDIPSNTTLMAPQIIINNSGGGNNVTLDIAMQYIETFY